MHVGVGVISWNLVGWSHLNCIYLECFLLLMLSFLPLLPFPWPEIMLDSCFHAEATVITPSLRPFSPLR